MNSTGLLSRFSRIIGRPRPTRFVDRRVPVWLTRLQQSDNPWLKAGRLERRGRFAAARRLYIEDADRQGGQGSHARAGVARAAAAEMMTRLGDDALARYEWQCAAEHFRAHAEQATRWSMRESAWAYERAAQLYAAAGLTEEAAKMRRRADDLAAHVTLPVHGIDVAPARLPTA